MGMGNVGSGTRRGEDRKKTTQELLALDIRLYRREGLIPTGLPEVLGGIPLEWTAPGYGGDRIIPWLRCPQPSCGRRVKILYYFGAPRSNLEDLEGGERRRGYLALEVRELGHRTATPATPATPCAVPPPALLVVRVVYVAPPFTLHR
ncbi:MAG: hypothetical protein CYG60_23925 [Actinobacteria bacterium]|nr:MAG: hypothetical protein CYG60_23925 [Actinomycetota bacterium]